MLEKIMAFSNIFSRLVKRRGKKLGLPSTQGCMVLGTLNYFFGNFVNIITDSA